MLRYKKIFSFVLILLVSLTTVGCGSSNDPYEGINLEDYIKVGDYKGLAVDKPQNVKVDDKAVEQEIQNRLEVQATKEEIKKGKAEEGDTVNIDYTGRVNGKKFEGGSAKDQSLLLGSKSMLPGFEKQIVGMEVGTEKNIKVTFPKKYTKELAGKDAEFLIKLNYIEKKTLPKLDENFIKENSRQASNEEEFKAEVKKDLETGMYDMQHVQARLNLWGQIVGKSEVKKDKEGNEKYPDLAVKRVQGQAEKFYIEMAKTEDMEYEEWIKKNFQMEMDDFKKQLEEFAKSKVKEEMIARYIAEKEGIELTEQEYHAYLNSLYRMNKVTKDDFVKQRGKSLEELQGEDAIKEEALRDKVAQFIYDKGVAKKPSKKEGK